MCTGESEKKEKSQKGRTWDICVKKAVSEKKVSKE